MILYVLVEDNCEIEVIHVLILCLLVSDCRASSSQSFVFTVLHLKVDRVKTNTDFLCPL